MKKSILIVTIGVFAFSGCLKKKIEDLTPPQTKNFTTILQFLDNASVKGAIQSGAIATNAGTTPPNWEGTYKTFGLFANACADLAYIIGDTIKSTYEFSAQTSGKLNFREILTGVSSAGTGSFVSGHDSLFTIYEESNNVDGSTTVVVFTGYKKTNNDLMVSGISTYTDSPPNNIKLGDWFSYKDVYFTKQ